MDAPAAARRPAPGTGEVRGEGRLSRPLSPLGLRAEPHPYTPGPQAGKTPRSILPAFHPLPRREQVPQPPQAQGPSKLRGASPHLLARFNCRPVGCAPRAHSQGQPHPETERAPQSQAMSHLAMTALPSLPSPPEPSAPPNRVRAECHKTQGDLKPHVLPPQALPRRGSVPGHPWHSPNQTGHQTLGALLGHPSLASWAHLPLLQRCFK